MSVSKICRWYSGLSPGKKILVAGLSAPIGIVGGVVAAPAVGAAVSSAGFGILGGYLFGAAASSAGLAALGGGAVAFGGMGVAGGTAVVAGSSAVAAMAATGVAGHFASKNGKKYKERVEDAESYSASEDEVRID